MRILHINRFFYSGQTTHVFTLVREQQKQGLDARLIMDGNPSYNALKLYQKTIDELGAKIYKPGDVQAIQQQLAQWHPRLIHAHSIVTLPLAATLARQKKVPLVITCHGLGINTGDYRPFLQEAAAIICISRRVANSLREFEDKIHLIPNGVDLAEFAPQEKTEPVKIALVSRIDPGKQKAYNHFCKAVDLLEGVEFYVAANQKPASKTAQYLGWISDVASLLAETDIVAGTGRTVIEGLACGNAVIILGKTCQGILTPEKVARQKELDLSGLSGNDPCYKNIFYELAKLTQNELYLRHLQKFGRKLAEEHFDIAVLAGKTMQVYESVL
ncbi:MAG TPA: glycosyltransferase family 4 protein [Firmicutes bacterium]|nr:glycosyltransferase family 4 protein [Bacillota bacterium]